MEDTSTTTRTSVTHRVSSAYSAKIYKQLVRRLTEDLNHGLANTCNDFNLEDKCAIHFLLEAGNYSYTSARAAAIIARRERNSAQRPGTRRSKLTGLLLGRNTEGRKPSRRRMKVGVRCPYRKGCSFSSFPRRVMRRPPTRASQSNSRMARTSLSRSAAPMVLSH